MAKKDYDRMSYLESRIDSCRGMVSSARSSIYAIEEKIDRLRKAKAEIQNIRDNLYSNKNIFFSIDYSNNFWFGSNSKKYGQNYYEAMDYYSGFESELNYFQDLICDQITRLENEKYEQNSLIGWYQSKINDFLNELEKLFN